MLSIGLTSPPVPLSLYVRPALMHDFRLSDNQKIIPWKVLRPAGGSVFHISDKAACSIVKHHSTDWSKLSDTGRWAHFNIKLLHVSFINCWRNKCAFNKSLHAVSGIKSQKGKEHEEEEEEAFYCMLRSNAAKIIEVTFHFNWWWKTFHHDPYPLESIGSASIYKPFSGLEP